MAANSFRAFGVLTLLLDALVLVWLVAAWWVAHWSPQRALRTLVLLTFVAAVGIGLLYLQKWAALYFSVPLFILGIWFAWTSVELEPFPLNLLCMGEGVSWMLPLIVTIRIWPQLK